MNGWDVITSPSVGAIRLALVVLLAVQVARTVRRARRLRSRRSVLDGPPSGRVGDSRIVQTYNDALLAGWPADDLATVLEVAQRVGTSRRHVEDVLGRRRAA